MARGGCRGRSAAATVCLYLNASFHELASIPDGSDRCYKERKSIVGGGIKAPADLPPEGKRAPGRPGRAPMARPVENWCEITLG
jgi:hypothetical protein